MRTDRNHSPAADVPFPPPSSERRAPSVVGAVMSLLGAMTAIAAVVLVAMVIWLDLNRAEAVNLGALAVRVVVIGGFLLVLAWMLWKVGSTMSGGSRPPPPSDA